jgi:DNA invertase Pin-like site-specific DNA recombinase
MDVVIYARLSLDKLGNELGVDRQLEACRELAARQGWRVTRELIDNSISATTGRVRPAFEKLLTLSPKPDAIIVWHLDRLVRLTRELDRVISYGVPVHAVTAGMLDLSNPTGVLMANVVTAFSQFEGQQKAARQRLAATQRASQGRPWWSARPFGYERDGSPRAGEADAVQRAYQDLLAGRSLLSIADEWNRQGMHTTRGRRWTVFVSSSCLSGTALSVRTQGMRSALGTGMPWCPRRSTVPLSVCSTPLPARLVVGVPVAAC